MVYLHPFHWAPFGRSRQFFASFTNVRPRHVGNLCFAYPRLASHRLAAVSQQPCHVGSHINLPVFSGWSEEVMKWRLQELHLWNFDDCCCCCSLIHLWQIVISGNTSSGYQSRTENRHLQPSCLWLFDQVFLPPRGDPKWFYRFMRHLVYVWEASEESASAAGKTLIFSTRLWKARHLR